MSQVIYCRTAPSLGELEGTPEAVWGTPEYEGDRDEPTVFFGLYGLPDFYTLWRHRGKKWVLWAGSDITHLKNGYFLQDDGSIRLDTTSTAQWINMNCENWCENKVEKDTLAELGISAQICPSFMGKIEDYNISYQTSDYTKVYTSVSGDNFELYGWHKIQNLAHENPSIEFHLYGNTKRPPYTFAQNVIVHGRVPKEVMNEEIKQMQGGLRLTEFDGFSEIIAKSVLWGQWPVSLIPYPHTILPDKMHTLIGKTEANYSGRSYYRTRLNKFPWAT